MLVGGLVAFGAYKMTTKQSQDIQAHTGVDPEEMTDGNDHLNWPHLGPQ
jgi:hypothetical protein